MSLRTIVFHFIWWRVSWNFLNGCICILFNHSAPTITGTVDKFKCHILAITISRPLYFGSLSNSSVEMCFFLTDRIDMSVWYHCISKTFIIKTGLLGCIVLLVYMTKFQSTVTIPPSSIGIGHTIFLHGDGFNVVISSNVFSYPIMLIFKFIWD